MWLTTHGRLYVGGILRDLISISPLRIFHIGLEIRQPNRKIDALGLCQGFSGATICEPECSTEVLAGDQLQS